MKGRASWLLTAPLLVIGLLVGHSLGYRWAVADPHARAHLLEESGHGYLAYVPLVVAVAVSLIAATLVTQVRAVLRDDRTGTSPPWLFGLLPPATFVVQELVERLLHSGHVHAGTIVEPAVLIGLLLQLPLAVIALGLAWLLGEVADGLGRALAHRPRDPLRGLAVPHRAEDTLVPAVAVSAQGWSERGPPVGSF